MKADILISGFGGQGLLSLGKIIARAGLKEGKFVSWIPSYGAEMRGGTAHCYTKISDKPIASPFIDSPDIAVILNQPSLDKFKSKLKKSSLLILNSDLAQPPKLKQGIKAVSFPLNKEAINCGNIKVVNNIALGIIVSLKNILKKETVIEVLKETFKETRVLAANLKGFNRGQSLILNKDK